jgi:deazaflavin-dependent oxidoreductase (nitroreductase family)
MSQAPALIRLSNPLATRLMRLGMPMGPNTIMTVRGRTSGEPRTAPVAVIEIDGRRYVMGAYGAVHWVRNLRAAGEAELQLHGRTVHVRARELDHGEAVAFFEKTLADYVARFPWLGRAFARVFFGLVGPEFLDDPQKAAVTKPIFELTIA